VRDSGSLEESVRRALQHIFQLRGYFRQSSPKHMYNYRALHAWNAQNGAVVHEVAKMNTP
jgi:hypothetical protein